METRFVLFRSLLLGTTKEAKPCEWRENKWNSVCCSWFPETLICDYQISFTNFDLRYWRQTVNKMQWSHSHLIRLQMMHWDPVQSLTLSRCSIGSRNIASLNGLWCNFLQSKDKQTFQTLQWFQVTTIDYFTLKSRYKTCFCEFKSKFWNRNLIKNLVFHHTVSFQSWKGFSFLWIQACNAAVAAWWMRRIGNDRFRIVAFSHPRGNNMEIKRHPQMRECIMRVCTVHTYFDFCQFVKSLLVNRISLLT